MTAESIERDAEILLEKLKNQETDPSLISIIVLNYIGASGVIEDLPVLDISAQVMRKINALHKPESIPFKKISLIDPIPFHLKLRCSRYG